MSGIDNEVEMLTLDETEYSEAYSAPCEWFIAMANHARRLSGVSGTLTPAEILNLLIEATASLIES